MKWNEISTSTSTFTNPTLSQSVNQASTPINWRSLVGPTGNAPMHTNLPDSCLIGIALTVSTHSGPQLVYHYPPINYAAATNSKKDHHLNKKKHHYSLDQEEEAASDSSSSSDDYSSGLSDSELSTDYADTSSSDSDSSSSSLDHHVHSPSLDSQHGSTTNMDESNNGRNNSVNISTAASVSNSGMLRSRQSQISANKLFQLLNNGNNNNNNSTSLTNASGSLRDSLYSGFTDPYHHELDQDLDPELQQLVQELLDDSMFQRDAFQDVSKVLNFNAEFVAELCCPRKEMCNTRFEFTVDDLCFLGLPIHADAKGRWKKAKKRKHSSKKSATVKSSGRNRSNTEDSTNKNQRQQQQQDQPTTESDDESGQEGETSKSEMLNEMYAANEEEFESLEKSINMFQVCFIMNPQIIEYNERVDDMYHFVVTRLSLILRYIQGKNGYVTKECANIIKCRDQVTKHSPIYKSLKSPWRKGKFLYERILYQSSLARALTKCFNCIKNNQIANLEIDRDKIVSLQIPIKTEFSVLPNLKEDPVIRGSYLSSILNESFLGGSLSGGIAEDSENIYANHERMLDFGLLLLDEPENIVKGLENASFDNGITDLLLINLVRQLKPTYRLFQYKGLIKELLDSNDDSNYNDEFLETTLKSLCLHLIYWRHARLILPLSPRYTYIVSPLAPISGFSNEDYAHAEYDTVFKKQNTLTSNTDDISLIYQNKKSFSDKFPSLPSLPSFLQLISTQKPKPFGHIIPSNEHKAMYLNALAWLMRYGYLTQLLTFVYIRVDKRIKIAVDEDLERDGIRSNKKGRSDNFVSGGENYNGSDFDDLEMLNDNDFTIILEPERNTALEKRWLFKCAEALPPDLQVLFKQAVKYFNGKIPLEYVMIKENIPKHEMKRLLQALGNYVVEVKHW